MAVLIVHSIPAGIQQLQKISEDNLHILEASYCPEMIQQISSNKIQLQYYKIT